MRYHYYKQGVHAVRVYQVLDTILKVERFDGRRRRFVQDFDMLERIQADIDTQKITIKEFWELVAQLRNFSLN